jgi:hypothetical protein
MFGTYGQLKPVDFPMDWYEVNAYLNKDSDDFNVLFLPWHQYMNYSWSPNRYKKLANPSREFFDKPVIRGDNIEVSDIYSQDQNPTSTYVEFLLDRAGSIQNLGELLSPLNVKYIILIKESDYGSYGFLRSQDDLALELEGPTILLFRNLHPTARAYGVNKIIAVEGLPEYLELSQKQDVLDSLYVVGESTTEGTEAHRETIQLSRESPVVYRVAPHASRYLVFTVPQFSNWEHWEFNGRQSLGNLGFMPAFESNGAEGMIVYTRFRQVYLPSYAVSVMAVVTSIVILLPWRGRRTRETAGTRDFPRL